VTLRRDLATLDEEHRRIGNERSREAWLRVRRLLVALDEVCRRHERSEDDTREVPQG
jgi:hypothetical protein